MGIHSLLARGRTRAHGLVSQTRGNVSLFAALAFVPFAMAATSAVDLGNAIRMKASLQAAADAGVLASATALATGHNDGDKKKIAEDVFFANVPQELLAAFPAKPETFIDFPSRKVHMKVKVNTDQLMTRLIVDSMALAVDATAAVDPGPPICLLALNPSAWKALDIEGTADVMAKSCAVHVNSSHHEAMRQTGSGRAEAESFCVEGSYSGDLYTPKPDDDCLVEKDPLEAIFADALAQTDLTTCKAGVPTSTDSDLTLSPGVYCGGLTVKKGVVTLQPGVYVFRDGEFYVQAQGTVQGEGVTILLTGNSDTRLVTQAGASLDIKAPSEGPFAGIVIAQDPASIPSKENVIIGGGYLSIAGIIYLPEQPLKVTGNGEIGSDVVQFAIIADTIAIEGNGLLTIHISSDYEAAGLPKLPEAHEVVRLVE